MDSLVQYIQQADPAWAYTLLFLSAFVENIFPPIPGDTVTVVGAYLVGKNVLNYWGVLLSTTAGSILGFMGIFGLAYLLEWRFLERLHFKWVSPKKITRVEKYIHRYGYWVILLNRFLSGVRSVISLVAGLSKMKTVRVFILALISCLVWNAALIYGGSTLGKNWKDIIDFLKSYNRILMIGLGGLAALFIIYYIIRKTGKKKKLSS
ncbi:MAG: DedA family protein [Calditrichia bacterium]